MAKGNLHHALVEIIGVARADGRCPSSYNVIVDTASSKLNMGIGYSPCLTASRGAGRAFVDLQTAKKLSLSEMLRLQGFTTEEMAGMNFVGARSSIGHMAGNAFTKTVIMRIVRAALSAAEAGLPR